jgi:opacity protein-like surface antigen
MLTDKSQVYVKLAYIKADVKITDRTPEFVSANSESVDGYSIGAGYANMITNNVSFFVEVNYLKYGEEDVSSNYVAAGYRQTLSLPADIDAYNAKIGIAYKF